METQTIIYILLALAFIYVLISKITITIENLTDEKSCSRNDINNQFYRYNVNTINRPIRPY